MKKTEKTTSEIDEIQRKIDEIADGFSEKIEKAKNCPNCKYYKPIEETIYKRDGKTLVEKLCPDCCLKDNDDIMNNWFKTGVPFELECFEQK